MESLSLAVAVRNCELWRNCEIMKAEPSAMRPVDFRASLPRYYVKTEQDDRPFMIHKEDKNPQGLFYTLGF